MRTIIWHMPRRRNYLLGKGTVEIGYPWLTYGAILTMEERLLPQHKVLELGSGGSTIFFARRSALVKSYEHDANWASVVKGKLVSENRTNTDIVVGNIETLAGLVKKEPDEYYDWVLVDSGYFHRKGYSYRLALMRESVPKLKSGGYMIVDNYDQRQLRAFDYTGWKVFTFDDMNYRGKGTLICIKS